MLPQEAWWRSLPLAFGVCQLLLQAAVWWPRPTRERMLAIVSFSILLTALFFVDLGFRADAVTTALVYSRPPRHGAAPAAAASPLDGSDPGLVSVVRVVDAGIRLVTFHLLTVGTAMLRLTMLTAARSRETPQDTSRP